MWRPRLCIPRSVVSGGAVFDSLMLHTAVLSRQSTDVVDPVTGRTSAGGYVSYATVRCRVSRQDGGETQDRGGDEINPRNDSRRHARSYWFYFKHQPGLNVSTLDRVQIAGFEPEGPVHFELVYAKLVSDSFGPHHWECTARVVEHG